MAVHEAVGESRVNRWGAILLIAYIVIGLSPLGSHKAMRYAIWLTGAMLLVVGFSTGAL